MPAFNTRQQQVVLDSTQFTQLQAVLASTAVLAATASAAATAAVAAVALPKLLSVETGITASIVQTQAGATPLTKEYNRVDVCVTANDSLLLPKAVTGKVVLVGLMYNLAESPQIFPAVGDEIQASGGVDQPRPMSPGVLYTFYAASDTHWNFSTPSYI